MEVDDDFGDLYSDVLLPVASEPASPPNPNSNPTHSPPAATAPAASSAPPGVGDKDDDWLLGGAGSPTVDPISNWADDDEETNTNPSKIENPRVSVSSPDQTIPGVSAADVADLDDPPPSIPGLKSANLPAENDDWDDSDSEDDLKIVLNDTEHGAMDEMMYEEGDEDEDLVIVTNDDQIGAMDQDWGEEGGLSAAGEGGEGKEGDKVPGLGGTGGAPGASRVGYSNHGFHHSTYKYVRPGAPVPGGGPGAQGQVRPPLPAGPYPGRGRGEWRPAGGFRGPFNSWPNQNRPFGLDFSLPPQKTIFDFEIDSFEEKPWKYPGADLSDFFNFGMDEETWKDYCKRLGQLKIESTMQSKIRVYESGRSEPEFDPDLPPELAAATGQNEIIPENNMRSNGQVDFNNSQGSNSNRPQLPTGRAILVESSYAERLPSMDTRPARLRESDTIIEIVLLDSFRDDDDGNNNGDVADKTEREESRGYSENDDFSPDQHRPRQKSPRRGSSNKRHSSPSSDEEESYDQAPKQKDINENEKEDKDTQTTTQEAATKDPSVDGSQSEQLVYSEPEDFNSVDQEAAEDSQSQSQSQSRSQSQSKNSLREREEEESCRRAATRSHGHSRSERDDDLAPHDRLSLPKVAHASRKDGRMLGHFNHNSMNHQHHYNNNSHGNNGMKWRGHDEVFYHQQPPHQQQHFMHVRERDFVPHGFRGRSFERFNRGGFREEEGLERFNKGVRVYEREDDLGFRVRKRVEEREDEWRGVRKRERDDFLDVNFKRRKDEERRGKVDREEVWMIERKRERERDREREESVIRVNNKDSRHREREERERERHKSKNILSHEREESRGGTTTARISQSQNRNGSSTSRDEVKNEERERKLREKLLLNNNNNNNNSNINNNSNLERGSSRHERDRYRDGGTRRSRAGTDNNNTSLDQRNPKRRHDDHKSGEQGSLKKLQVGPTSDEEEDSRRGRSKMERWNSHKEREDFTPVNKLDVSSSAPTGEDPAEKANLDTVERLKRRSERFKVPLHGDKERDGEGELTGQSQSQMEVKPERPARKRRWTGS